MQAQYNDQVWLNLDTILGIKWFWLNDIDKIQYRQLTNDEIQDRQLTNDEIQGRKLASKDPLHIRGGPRMRSRAKRMQEALSGLIKIIWAKTFANSTMGEQQRLVTFMHVQP